jgi:hypothetical protein
MAAIVLKSGHELLAGPAIGGLAAGIIGIVRYRGDDEGASKHEPSGEESDSTDTTSDRWRRTCVRSQPTKQSLTGGIVATSKRVAKKASKILSSPKSTKAEKSVAASDLSAAKRKTKPQKKK